MGLFVQHVGTTQCAGANQRNHETSQDLSVAFPLLPRLQSCFFQRGSCSKASRLQVRGAFTSATKLLEKVSLPGATKAGTFRTASQTIVNTFPNVAAAESWWISPNEPTLQSSRNGRRSLDVSMSKTCVDMFGHVTATVGVNAKQNPGLQDVRHRFR